MADRRVRGLTLILVATAIAGVGGYAITTVAARGLGPEGYATFAVFWAALYFVVGSVAGIQQETTRASRPGPSRNGHVLSKLIGGVTVVLAILLVALVAVAERSLFPKEGWALGAPLIVGSLASISVATITGLLYGVRAWRTLAVVIIGDVALRLIGVSLVFLLHGDVVLVAWATVVPWVVVAIGLAVALQRGRHLRASLDVGLGPLAINVAQTIAGGVGISLLVSGFPLFIRLFSAEQDAASVGVLVYALILTRAPLVVSVLALQSYLVVFLRDRAGHLARTVLELLGGLILIGVLLAALAALVGPWLITALAGEGFAVTPLVLALLVLVSMATAGLAVTGSAVLARGLHGWYVAGWTVAAVLSVALLAVPGDLTTRVIVALAAGPLAGIGVHLTALRRKGASPSSDAEQAPTPPARRDPSPTP